MNDRTHRELAVSACSPESRRCLGLHPEECGQQDWGGDSVPLLS